jgi:hypothetical protein
MEKDVPMSTETTPTLYLGWIRQRKGRWAPFCRSKSRDECWDMLLLNSPAGCDRTVTAEDVNPNDKQALFGPRR